MKLKCYRYPRFYHKLISPIQTTLLKIQAFLCREQRHCIRNMALTTLYIQLDYLIYIYYIATLDYYICAIRLLNLYLQYSNIICLSLSNLQYII